mmetsp:Transcript_14045/g.21066  ORF Transcript_14045/g.21066 Transcript_14045/m.21066 type:complete len:216 (-) Transcript_14045:307-954(-)
MAPQNFLVCSNWFSGFVRIFVSHPFAADGLVTNCSVHHDMREHDTSTSAAVGEHHGKSNGVGLSLIKGLEEGTEVLALCIDRGGCGRGSHSTTFFHVVAVYGTVSVILFVVSVHDVWVTSSLHGKESAGCANFCRIPVPSVTNMLKIVLVVYVTVVDLPVKWQRWRIKGVLASPAVHIAEGQQLIIFVTWIVWIPDKPIMHDSAQKFGYICGQQG